MPSCVSPPGCCPARAPWIERFKALFGFVLLAMAIVFPKRILDTALPLALWGAWLIGAATALRQAARTESPSPGRLVSRTAGALLALWSAMPSSARPR
ncbi:hypothetical protein [Halomonas koreensis]|uniref:Uncharacterized protein n=1 Tax=Halomonas koreensis TaxID=245385 RepID=A0ABU1G6C7_9GAMM|nr:hypothetical protein [Halomonas koreensis]MDR5868492.1 hypothetical protein [Halomonas koreensis]